MADVLNHLASCAGNQPWKTGRLGSLSPFRLGIDWANHFGLDWADMWEQRVTCEPARERTRSLCCPRTPSCREKNGQTAHYSTTDGC